MFSFRAINIAFELNQKYYYKERIVELMLDLQDNGKLTSYRAMGLENATKWNIQMQNEINEILATSLPIKKIMLFEHLEYIQTIFGFDKLERDSVWDYIKDYNEAEYNDFESKVLEKEIEFKKSDNYSKLNHLDEYDVVFFDNYTRKEKFKKFICVESKPKLIDTDLFYRYEEILERTIGEYVSILSRYINLYKSGKLGDIELENKSVQKGNQESISPKNKIRVKATVEELVFVFRLLNEGGLFDATNEELSHFISENFTTKRASRQISINNLINLFSKSDKKSIDFMTRILIKIEAVMKKLK